MSYTVLAVVGVLAAAVLDLFVLRTRLLVRRVFWVSYAIIVVFQLISNGILTGRSVVVYAPSTIIGLRIAWAPVEDLAFGFSLVLQSQAWWVWWGRRTDPVTGQLPVVPRRARVARQSAGPATESRRGSDTATRRSSTR